MTDRDESSLDNFLDGLVERVQSGKEWQPGLVICGDAPNAGTAYHDGDKIPAEQFEARLEYHREKYGEPEGVARINLNVVYAEAEPFEREVISPEMSR